MMLTATVACPRVAAAPSAHSATRAALRMLRIINHDRSTAGVRPLAFSPLAARAALAHSMDMAEHRYVSHTGRDGSSPFRRITDAGVSYRLAGENIGYDSGTRRAAMLRAIEAAMLRSPEHRANLLRAAFTTVGIGVVVDGPSLYVTEDFTD